MVKNELKEEFSEAFRQLYEVLEIKLKTRDVEELFKENLIFHNIHSI